MKPYLTIVMLLLVADGVAAASITVAVEATQAAPGEEVIVPIAVRNGQGLGALQFQLLYDPEVLEWTSGEIHPNAGSGTLDHKVVEPGRVRIALVFAEKGIAGDAALVNARFRIAANAAGKDSNVKLTAARAWTHKDILEMQVETESNDVKVVAPSPSQSTPLNWILIGAPVALILVVLLLMMLRRKQP